MTPKALLTLVGACGLAVALSGCNGALLQAISGKDDPTLAYADNAAGPLLPEANPLTTATVSKTNEGQGVGVETLVIDVDGQHYELPMLESGGSDQYYSNDGQTTGDSIFAVQFGREYASLVMLFEITPGQASAFPNIAEDDVGAFAVIATGTVATPVGDLPAQIVNYGGSFLLAISQNGVVISGGQTSHDFTAVADFTTGTLEFETDLGAIGVATITGNRFGGALAGENDEMALEGQMAGGFYGPAAEDISGVAGGTFTNKTISETYNFAAGFVGGQVNAP